MAKENEEKPYSTILEPAMDFSKTRGFIRVYSNPSLIIYLGATSIANATIYYRTHHNNRHRIVQQL